MNSSQFRILIMCKVFINTGVARHIMDLSKTLQERGHEVWIMSSCNLNEEFCRINNIRFIKQDFSLKPISFFKNLRSIYKFIKLNHIDIVHCHHRMCSLYMNFVSKISHTPFVWTNHLNNIPSDLIHRATTFTGNRVICVSSELKQFCISKLKVGGVKYPSFIMEFPRSDINTTKYMLISSDMNIT